MHRLSPALLCLVLAATITASALAAGWELPNETAGDRALAEYFAAETQRIADESAATVASTENWQETKADGRAQLLEMLGLDPLPEKTDLKPVITGTVEREDVVVEKLHFQSRPGLYVTCNLYRPKTVEKPLPAILYVCGHGQVKKDGVSYGNKVHYQHHGYWYAKHGYICLTIDTLQLGEVEGIHHGTHRYGRWWWLNRGYTPAGVEAWNCVRALDYLQSRSEVDGEKLGVTGRSGGGAYSWWIATIDERIKCAVPTAGITDLTNHVVDGCVEGHCDCMYMVNTYRWDYSQLAAMVAPRPMLLTNTDTDPIFPLDGVVRIFEHTRKAYQYEKAAPALGLNITAGGHVDTQEQQVHAMRWFDRHLKGEQRLITSAAEKHFTPEQLKVLDTIPSDEINTKIDETFVATAPAPKVAADEEEWTRMRNALKESLTAKSFRAWPDLETDIVVHGLSKLQADGVEAASYSIEHKFVKYYSHVFSPFSDKRPRLFVINRAGLKKPEKIYVHLLDESTWKAATKWWPAAFGDGGSEESEPKLDWSVWNDISDDDPRASPSLHAFVVLRCEGPQALSADEKKLTQIHRRFYLLGQTLDGMRVWDVCYALRALRNNHIGEFRPKQIPIEITAEGTTAGIALYAALFEPVGRLELIDLPTTHRNGPYFLNVSRILEMPQAVAMAAERTPIVLRTLEPSAWEYPQAVAKKLGWSERLKVEAK